MGFARHEPFFDRRGSLAITGSQGGFAEPYALSPARSGRWQRPGLPLDSSTLLA